MAARSTGPDPSWQEGKIQRGWRLTQVAWKLIRQDRAMLRLALAGIASAFAAAFAVFALGGYFSGNHHSGAQLGIVALVALYPSTALGVFFNVALAGAASAAFDGEPMSAGEAMRIAWGKRGQVLGWSLLSAIVGVLIAEIANRLPGGARVVGWFLGAAWGLATIFVVPILAIEGTGALEAVRRSSQLVKRRWGEGLSGNIAIGAWSVLAVLPLGIMLGIGAALVKHQPAVGVVLIATSLLGLVAVSTGIAATRQVFAVALYRYAIDAPIGGFAASDLEYPFVADRARQQRKSWILRIGGSFLALFFVVAIIVAIVGPRHHHTAAEGYFHAYYSAAEVAGVGAGTPVVYEGRGIGSVLSTEAEGASIRLVFRVNPQFSSVIASSAAFIDEAGGRKYLRIGSPPVRGSPG